MYHTMYMYGIISIKYKIFVHLESIIYKKNTVMLLGSLIVWAFEVYPG